jgi:uncharacterized protein YjdB
MLALLLYACVGSPSASDAPTLSFEPDGPVRTTRLGPVTGPRLVGAGSAAVAWTVTEPAVARVDPAGVVVAIAPGSTEVRATVGSATAAWTLSVEPVVVLSIDRPPATIAVGEARSLVVLGRIGPAQVPAGEVTWASSAPEVLAVEGGEIRGLAPGRGYVSVTGRNGAAAMAEIEVVAP